MLRSRPCHYREPKKAVAMMQRDARHPGFNIGCHDRTAWRPLGKRRRIWAPLLVLLWTLAMQHGAASALVDCCTGEYAVVECGTESRSEYNGLYYSCFNITSAEMQSCISCVPPSKSGIECASCCAERKPCRLKWHWSSVATTLCLSALFATCSGILALAERRRKTRGLSLARAWSIPRGMPVLRATVIDISDAMRGRGNLVRIPDGDGDMRIDDDVEHAALLRHDLHDPVYGALLSPDPGNIPTAKPAADLAVTAIAMNAGSEPISYDAGCLSPVAAARWRSARAMAREPRRYPSRSSRRGQVSAAWSSEWESEDMARVGSTCLRESSRAVSMATDHAEEPSNEPGGEGDDRDRRR